MPGARCARSLVCEIKKHTSVVTTVTPETPGIPRAMVLTASFALSSATGLVCHRHQRKLSFTDLTPASGRQDHTTSPSAGQRPRLWHHPRPPHPVPNVRDDRETPLERGTGREGYRCDLGRRRSEMFFSKRLDSRIHLASHFTDLPAGQVGMRSRPPNGPALPVPASPEFCYKDFGSLGGRRSRPQLRWG